MDWLKNTIGEFTKDFANDCYTKLKNLDDNTRALKRKIELLECKEVDINTQLQNAGSGPSKKRCKKEVRYWLENVTRNIEEFGSLEEKLQGAEWHHVPSGIKLAEQVEKMTKEVDDLVQQGNFPGGLFFDDVHEYIGQLLLTSQEKSPALEKNLKEFWKSFENAISIGIYGMGGIGKTLLAKHINDNLVDGLDFEVYWVTVSQESSIYKLQNDIAKALKLEFSSEGDKIVRAGELFQKLSQKERVVFILDDVWKKIDPCEIGIPLGMDKCRLVITSRSKEVCDQIGCQDIIKVKTLPNKEAWDLFLMKLAIDPIKLSPEVEEMAQIVAQKCDGLPLAIVAMAGSLRGVTDVYEWRDVLEELNESRMGQEGMENDVFPILECSFNRLRDPKLQNCFLYCCMYPEDYCIRRDRLIKMFISEGLMDRTSREANFAQGHAILNKLEYVCLLERVRDGVYVKMHDLIRDMALRITKGKYMVKAGLQLREIPSWNEWGEDLEKVSLMENGHILEIPFGISQPNCPRLTTLILSRCSKLKLIPDSFFVLMPGLSVLNLSWTGIEKLPKSVSMLKKLKSLLLEYCNNLIYVPPVGKLKALEEVDLKFTQLEKLPKGTENLTNLKRLETYGSLIDTIPKGISLSNLQRLILAEHTEVPIGLGRLNQLEELYVGLHCMHEFDRVIRGTQQGNSKLNFYDISVGDRDWDGSVFESEDEDKDEDGEVEFFYSKHKRLTFGNGSTKKRGSDEEKIILPSNVEELSFNGSGLSSFLFDNFQQLTNNGKGSIDLGIVCEPEITGIMRLPLEEERWMVEGEELHWSCSVLLKKLKRLRLFDLPNLSCLFSKREGLAAAPFPPGAFSQLAELDITECNKIKKLIPWSLAENLQNLKQLRITECKQMEEIVGDDKIELEGLGTACSISSSSTVNMPRLKGLHLCELPALQRICKGKIICDSIEELVVWGCEQIEEIIANDKNELGGKATANSSAVVTLPRLNELILDKLPGQDDNFSQLKLLNIRCCYKIKKLIPWSLVENLQNLEKLYVYGCGEIEEIIGDDKNELGGMGTSSNSGVVTLPRLSKLTLGGLPALQRICKGKMICDSIKELDVSDCEQLEEIIGGDKNELGGTATTSSSAVATLPRLDGLILDKLPEQDSTFSQLKRLKIFLCNKIKKLIPWSLVENFQNLEEIEVWGCEQMEEIFRDDKNELEGMGTSSSSVVVTLPRLRKLSLYNLPALRRICKGKMICDSIEQITIFKCENVKKMPLDLPLRNGQLSRPPSLIWIEAEKEWWESLESEHPNATSVLQPFLRFRE